MQRTCLFICTFFGVVLLGGFYNFALADSKRFESELPICQGSPFTFGSVKQQRKLTKTWNNCYGVYNYYQVLCLCVWKKEGEFRNGALTKGWDYRTFIDESGPRSEYYDADNKYQMRINWVKKKVPKPPILKISFVKLTLSDRKRIQTNLKILDLYKSSVDGLYGRRTATALSAYNKKNLNNSDLKVSANVSRLLAAVISHKFIPDPETFATIQKPKVPIVVPKPIPKKVNKTPPDETRKVASGTGFYVSDNGHIMTNHHVVDGCQEIKVHSKGMLFDTVEIASDAQNDLALLKVDAKPAHVFALSPDGSFPLQDIIVAGFPFGDRVSSTLKFTKGIVSSVAGLGNNYSEIQIDAALQPGNSGGPIIDDYGNVIAVAVSKLDMKKILKDYGVIPENTNFGVKASVVKNLMQGNAVQFKKPNTDVISKSELSKSATNGTVYLTCWMTTAQIKELKRRKVMFSEFED